MSNCDVNYDGAAAMVRQIVGLQAAHGGRYPRVDALHATELPRLLAEVEQGLAAQLQASGVAADVATYSALMFVSQCAEQYRASGRAQQ